VFWVIYSKTKLIPEYPNGGGPVFGFEYWPGMRDNPAVDGNIRAYFDAYLLSDMIENGQLHVSRFGVGEIPTNSTGMIESANLMGIGHNGGLNVNLGEYAVNMTDGKYNSYFEFDFWYDCSSEVGEVAPQNYGDLEIPGLGSVTSVNGTKVPYDYIITTLDYDGGGGSGTAPPHDGDGKGGMPGDDDGGGGNDDGGGDGDDDYDGGSFGDDDGDGLPDNDDGEGGRPGWGGGDYGGGVDRDDIDEPDFNEPFPEDWKEPIVDEYQELPGEYVPEFEPYEPGEGDTGERGNGWEWPELDMDDHGVTGEPVGYKDFEPGGEGGLIDFQPGGEQKDAEFKPGGEQGLLEFQPGGEQKDAEFKVDGEYGLIDFMNPDY
jgi:hypothetical protein